MDLHATFQMKKRYSNSKPVLAITRSEEIHRGWVQQNFDVYTCTKEEDISHEERVVQFIKQILSDVRMKLI